MVARERPVHMLTYTTFLTRSFKTFMDVKCTIGNPPYESTDAVKDFGCGFAVR
jgi:hypothetical protein